MCKCKILHNNKITKLNRKNIYKQERKALIQNVKFKRVKFTMQNVKV